MSTRETGVTMPAPARSLTVDAVRRFIEDQVFSPGATGAVGIELEWFPLPRAAPELLHPSSLMYFPAAAP